MGKRRDSGGGAASSRAVIDYQKLAAMLLVAVIFYNEYYAYYSAYASWPYEEEGESASVLLVADPQLQGLRDERHFGAVTRWDADRYLRKTFSWALSAYAVDAVVFLGDLLDEGSRTSDGEVYGDYVTRFKSIYPSDSAKVMIHLDGDNDVGGEGEPVTRENIRRFREHFGFKPGLNPVGDRVDIVVLDVLTMNASEVINLEPPKAERFRVGVSHVPVVPLAAGYSKFSKVALEHVRPDVVFSAHHHIGFDQAYSRHTGKSVYQGTKFSKGSNVPVRTNLTHDRESGIVHEIVVPTCSYRMGVPEMAFGLATFKFTAGGGGGMMVYHNLWLPSRFGNLFLYAAAVAVCLVLCCVGGIRSRRRHRRLSKRRSSGPDPYAKLI